MDGQGHNTLSYQSFDCSKSLHASQLIRYQPARSSRRRAQDNGAEGSKGKGHHILEEGLRFDGGPGEEPQTCPLEQRGRRI